LVTKSGLKFGLGRWASTLVPCWSLNPCPQGTSVGAGLPQPWNLCNFFSEMEWVCRGMARGASRFVILFHVVHFVTLSQRCAWVEPLLRHWSSLNLSIKISYLHKMVYSITSKSVPKGVIDDLSSQSLHPFHATTFVISHLGPHKNHDTLSRGHRYWSFNPR